MSDYINTSFVQEYKATTELLLQQVDSRFAPLVSQDSYTGKAGSVIEQFGEAAARKRTSRYQSTPNLDVEQKRPWVFPVTYDWGRQVDDVDKIRMLIDPTSPLTMAGVAAMNKSKDDEIIDSFFATMKVGENGDTDEAFDTTNYRVAVDTGGTGSSINVPKLQEASRMFMEAAKGEVDEPLYCAISSREHDALLKEIQVINKDFNGGDPVLVDGKVKRFMGFNFVITERLDITGGNRLIPCWRPSGMHLGNWGSLMVKVSEREDVSYNWQVYLRHSIGATRTQTGKVVQILCDDLI